MKRILILLALAVLALPTAAFAKGPSGASLSGPGLSKPLVFHGSEEPGTPLGDLTQQAGFFPAVFGQTPDPMLSARPAGDLGPKYTLDYTVPGPDNDVFHIVQSVYPYAKTAVTYTAPHQKIFMVLNGTRGGWYESPLLKGILVKAGLPKTAPSASATSNASFFSTGIVSLLVAGGLVLSSAAAFVVKRARRRPTA